MRRRKRVRVGGGHGEGGVGKRGIWQDVLIGPDMPKTSSMTSMFNVGRTSPTTSRREERMEPYPIPQDVADLGSSSGAGDEAKPEPEDEHVSNLLVIAIISESVCLGSNWIQEYSTFDMYAFAIMIWARMVAPPKRRS
jgi:hypothetical protein